MFHVVTGAGQKEGQLCRVMVATSGRGPVEEEAENRNSGRAGWRWEGEARLD